MYDTFITTQQKVKFLLHWLNLVLVHLYVFYYVPISTNKTLYGSSNCSPDSHYGCKEFRFNNELQNFYLLYCVYFYYSARQLALGFPALKRGS